MTDARAGGRVVVIGDVIDDVLVYPSGPIRAETDTPSRIEERPGGSAANTAAWLGSLGVPVDFHGRVGTGDAARHAAELARYGVRAHLIEDEELSTGRIVILVEADRRTFLTMRGASGALSVDVLDDAAVCGAAVVHLTGHSMLEPHLLARVPALIDRAHRAGARVVLDPSSAGFLGDLGAEQFREAVQSVDVLLPSLDEAVALTGIRDARDASAALLDTALVVVVTLGEHGCLVAERGREPVEVPAAPAHVVDPTGAGDAFAAGFIAAWARGADAVSAARAGTLVASRAVGERGGRPSPPLNEPPSLSHPAHPNLRSSSPPSHSEATHPHLRSLSDERSEETSRGDAPPNAER